MIDVEIICDAVDMYDGAIKKKAIAPLVVGGVVIGYQAIVGGIMIALTVYGMLTMVNMVATGVGHMEKKIGDIGDVISNMLKLIDKQRTQYGGFGKFEEQFTTWEKAAKELLKVIPELLQKCTGTDPSQVNKLEEFITNAGYVYSNSNNLLKLFSELQDWTSGLPNLIQAAQLNMGFDLTMYKSWETNCNDLSKSMGVLIVEAQQRQKAALDAAKKAQEEKTKPNQSVEPEPGVSTEPKSEELSPLGNVTFSG